MVVGDPIGYQVCLSSSQLGQDVQFQGLPVYTLRCRVDRRWAPEDGSDCQLLVSFTSHFLALFDMKYLKRSN